MKKSRDWSAPEYGAGERLIALGFEAILFAGVLPVLLVSVSTRLDPWLGLQQFGGGQTGGAVLIVLGVLLAGWSIEAQLTRGGGTPAPMMPTRRLVVRGPFAYCRNPMTVGTFLAYLGLALWIGSLAAIAIVGLVTGLLLLYVKVVEEKELEERFGEDSCQYKRKTPFIVPRLKPRA